MQVELDRLTLYSLLLAVPDKVVKHLHHLAQQGFDKARACAEASPRDRSGAGSGAEPHEEPDADEVGSPFA
jgi:hypothetical protein